jgi:polygalacturonase
MNRVNQKGLRISIIVFIAFSVWSSSFGTCRAREGRQWRQSKAGPVRKPKGYDGSNHLGRSMLNSAAGSSTFNVLDYGAKGDGHADDTKVIL